MRLQARYKRGKLHDTWTNPRNMMSRHSQYEASGWRASVEEAKNWGRKLPAEATTRRGPTPADSSNRHYFFFVAKHNCAFQSRCQTKFNHVPKLCFIHHWSTEHVVQLLYMRILHVNSEFRCGSKDTDWTQCSSTVQYSTSC